MDLSKPQKILLAITVFNLAIVFLFPPFDDVSVTNNGAAIFAGFLFIFDTPPNFVINSSLLYLEVAVVLINLCILWLLTTENARRQEKKQINFRKAAMALIGLNLIGVLLFPPFEYISNMTNAIIPTFEGFYFIFSHPPHRVIVTPVLYIEVFFILINGGLMLLAFKDNSSEQATAEQAMVQMARLQASKKAMVKPVASGNASIASAKSSTAKKIATKPERPETGIQKAGTTKTSAKKGSPKKAAVRKKPSSTATRVKIAKKTAIS
jgi:hypothetical protein